MKKNLYIQPKTDCASFNASIAVMFSVSTQGTLDNEHCDAPARMVRGLKYL